MKWQADPPITEQGDVIKIEVGKSIEGVLLEKYLSKKYEGKYIYRIKPSDGGRIKVLVGTRNLDRVMALKEVGCAIKIERLEDTPTDKGNPLQNYKTYSLKE